MTDEAKKLLFDVLTAVRRWLFFSAQLFGRRLV